MKSTTITTIVVFLITLFPFVCLSAFAQTVVVPNSLENTEADGGNRFPFNCGAFDAAPSMRYQQVYLGSQFPQAGIIDKISFRLSNRDGIVIPGFGPTVLPNVLIELSTTQTQPSALSSTFADNMGPDVQPVFSGDLSLSALECNTQPCPFDIMILLQNPFFYNPEEGNLLLDVRIPDCVSLNPNNPLITFFDETTISATITTQVFSETVNSDVATITRSNGLVTQFRITELRPIATNIPTISEWGLIITAGLLGIIGLMVIRRGKLRV